MPRLFLSHLLAVWLLLSQLPAETQGQKRKEKKQDFIKLCGSELALYWIRLCGNLNWDRMALSPKEPRLRSGPLAEIMPLTLAKDAETFHGLESDPASPQERQSPLGELQAAFKDSDLNSEEFKENILTRQSEAEDNSQSELKDTGSALHFPKKRSAPTVIVDRCCNYGCYRRELARFC
ncbi:prorelaxin-like [Hipposideros larvatus]